MGLFWFITGVVLLALSVVSLMWSRSYRKELKANASNYRDKERGDLDNMRAGLKFAAAVLFILGGFTIVWDSWTMVSPKNVGVVDNMGSADRTLNNGPHWVYPWANVNIVDATTKNINLDADAHNCMSVRLRMGQEACVDLTGQWHINQDRDANLVWQKYRGKDDLTTVIETNVVKRELQRALNDAFASYDPLAFLNTGKESDENSGTLSNEVLRDMQSRLPSGVVMENFLISQIHYDAATQSKLDAFSQAQGDTRIAQQQTLTAAEQKLAAQKLAEAAAALNNPGIQYQNCLNMLNALALKDQLKNLPASFNCGNGGSVILQPNTR